VKILSAFDLEKGLGIDYQLNCQKKAKSTFTKDWSFKEKGQEKLEIL